MKKSEDLNEMKRKKELLISCVHDDFDCVEWNISLGMD